MGVAFFRHLAQDGSHAVLRSCRKHILHGHGVVDCLGRILDRRKRIAQECQHRVARLDGVIAIDTLLVREQVANFRAIFESPGNVLECPAGVSAKPSYRTVFFRNVIMLTDAPLEPSIEIKELARIVTFAHTETSRKNSFGTHSHS